MTYQSDLKAHLSLYRCERLGIQETGTFRYRGRDVPCGHILPRVHEERNLLDLARPLVRAYQSSHPDLKRHRYFHHLNSSQAFAFNLFFPYFGGGSHAASVLLRAFGQASAMTSWQPEAVPDDREGTNIDVIWNTADGLRTFCEVKLSEADFGKAADDDEHRRKLRDTYTTLLAADVDADMLEPLTFFGAYQLMRNVWHMVHQEQSRLILLLPRSNVGLWTILNDYLPCLKSGTRARVSAVAIEDVIAALETDDACPPNLRAYAGELRMKYIC